MCVCIRVCIRACEHACVCVRACGSNYEIDNLVCTSSILGNLSGQQNHKIITLKTCFSVANIPKLVLL